jgi:ABC-type dipeptide/oligopeptide/nickel transport system permease component
LGEYATEEAVAQLEHELGLDKPLVTQIVSTLWNYIHGDFGISLRNRRPVLKEIIDQLPFTVELAIAGIIVACFIGIPAGFVAALKPNSFWDFLCRVIALLGISMPVFWLGLLLIFGFCVRLRWFPSIGAGTHSDLGDLLQRLVLPSLAIGANGAAIIMRMTRSCLLETLSEDYIRTAYSKGLPSVRVYIIHAMRNAAIPLLTIIGLNFGYLLGGAVVTETIFSRPGIGKLIIDAVLWRDYPVVQGCLLIFAIGIALTNLLVDISYAFLDPRVRLE